MKMFKEGQRLEVQPETWEQWVDCVYLMPMPDMKGWHRVRRVGGGGDHYIVPTRRIRQRI